MNHAGQMPAVTLSFDVRPGAGLSDAVTQIQNAARGTLTSDVTTNFAAEPAVNVTVAVSVSEAPLSVPAIVALPAVTEDVNVAV